jgi:hypothetical protein
MYGTMSYEDARLTVPSPLVGEGQGEGYNRHKACFQVEVLLNLEAAHKSNLTRGASPPPLSLSLPHKGGGNDVARTFTIPDLRVRKP